MNTTKISLEEVLNLFDTSNVIKLYVEINFGGGDISYKQRFLFNWGRFELTENEKTPVITLDDIEYRGEYHLYTFTRKELSGVEKDDKFIFLNDSDGNRCKIEFFKLIKNL